MHDPTPRAPRRLARAAALFAALLAALALGGCATVLDGHPQAVFKAQDDIDRLASSIDAAAIAGCLAKPDERCRNRIVGGRMYAADLRFAEFEARLFRDGRITEFGGSVAAAGLSAAGAVATTGATQALSALNTLLLGSRAAYQKDLLAERTAAALHTAMHAQRTQVAARIRRGLGQPLAEYPFEIALADLNDYVRAGTLVGAITGVTEAVGASAQQAERDLRRVTIADYAQRDEAARAIEAALCGGKPACAAPDPAALARAAACARKNGLDDPDAVLSLIDGATAVSAAQRQRVLACLKTGS